MSSADRMTIKSLLLDTEYTQKRQLWRAACYMVAGQLGPKSSRPLSQLGPGSTRPESTRPGVFSERSGTYIYCIWCVLYMYTLSEL